jgi:hypothetical protein
MPKSRKHSKFQQTSNAPADNGSAAVEQPVDQLVDRSNKFLDQVYELLNRLEAAMPNFVTRSELARAFEQLAAILRANEDEPPKSH